MIATITQNAPVITESKIIHKSAIVHPLARFVTEQTVALMFNIQIEQIYQIQCWRYVVYVHGHGISKFVSYADFPAILEVEPPKAEDFVRWRKRWYKCTRSQQAPEFWTKFYGFQFNHAASYQQLRQWGQLVGLVKNAIAPSAIEKLRQTYQQNQQLWNNWN
ncbi:MAG TPA: hypothetical protein DCQ51_04985 [Planktothrix sp. UBA8407]|jgi:hypothetical protein|nr:hypothetical protein [Planktothrix sp. UBA8402]HAO10533.1 hypothetical protein [Planktothrix sp. UBA8407]